MLRQLYNQSRVAKAFFERAARRERDQSETKVDRILALLKGPTNEFQRREIIELFRTDYKNKDADSSLKDGGDGLLVLYGRRADEYRQVRGRRSTRIEPISDEEVAAGVQLQGDEDERWAEEVLTQRLTGGSPGRTGTRAMMPMTGVSEIKEYDITASPNDFNILTLHSFIESGAVKIPGFQRNFVLGHQKEPRS